MWSFFNTTGDENLDNIVVLSPSIYFCNKQDKEGSLFSERFFKISNTLFVYLDLQNLSYVQCSSKLPTTGNTENTAIL